MSSFGGSAAWQFRQRPVPRTGPGVAAEAAAVFPTCQPASTALVSRYAGRLGVTGSTGFMGCIDWL